MWYRGLQGLNLSGCSGPASRRPPIFSQCHSAVPKPSSMSLFYSDDGNGALDLPVPGSLPPRQTGAGAGAHRSVSCPYWSQLPMHPSPQPRCPGRLQVPEPDFGNYNRQPSRRGFGGPTPQRMRAGTSALRVPLPLGTAVCCASALRGVASAF